jgi:imidazolonepropionase-like amidohydrolase
VYRTELNELEEEEAKKEGNEEIINMLLRIKSTIATVDSIVDLLSAHGVKLLVGQDNVKPEGTAEEMILLSKAGVKNEEVLKGATLYAAEWLGIADKYGSIEQGKMADLVILNGDPIADIANIKDVYQVIQHGKIIK